MANQIQHTYGTAAPASGALAKSEIAVRHIAANCTASSSSMLYVGEDAGDDGVTARALGTGVSGDSGQGGAAIGGNITFTGGTDITTSVSGSTVTITSSAGGGSGDITAVVAGTGLSGGATSGSATLNVDAAQSGITSLGTLTSLTVDDITINGSTISDASDLTIDVGGDILIDADGDDIDFKWGGATGWLSFHSTNSGDSVVHHKIDGKDLVFKQYDGDEAMRITDTGYVQITTALVPDSAGGADLGTSASRWDDLFLDNGSVTNWNNGDATLTHSSNALTLAGAKLQMDSTYGIHFNDASQKIYASSGAILNIEATDEIQLDATTIDMNGALDLSGNATLAGIVLDGNTITGVNDSGEFDDDDSHIMTSAGVNDRITSFGYTTASGTCTSVGISPGTGLDAGSAVTGSGTISVTLDLSELTDGTSDIDSNDEVIYLDNGSEKRKAFSELKLSEFNNDSGWTANSGDITGVTAGSGMSGGGTSGGVTLTNAGVTSIVAGSGISISGATGAVTVTASGGGGGVSLSGTTNNTVATVTGSDALVGEGTFTFDGAGALVLSDRSPTITMGSSHPAAAPHIKMYEGTSLKSGSSANITVATEWMYDAMSGAVMAIGSTEYDFAGGIYMGAV